MNRKLRKILICVCSAGLSAGIMTTVWAGQDVPAESVRPADSLPIGPEIDFCPTLAQSEAHLERFGFDYKPTVACLGDSEFTERRGDPDDVAYTDDELTKAERRSKREMSLRSSTPLPDSDGDPSTIEGMTADGEKFKIYVHSSEPERYRDMTPREFAEETYP